MHSVHLKGTLEVCEGLWPQTNFGSYTRMPLNLCNPDAPPITFSRGTLLASNRKSNVHTHNASAKVSRQIMGRLPAEMQREDQQNHALG
jgi:hypothetical protein